MIQSPKYKPIGAKNIHLYIWSLYSRQLIATGASVVYLIDCLTDLFVGRLLSFRMRSL